MLCVFVRIASSKQFLLHSTYHYFIEDRKYISKLSSFTSWPDDMINPHWLELAMNSINFYGPKDVRAIEIGLYVKV